MRDIGRTWEYFSEKGWIDNNLPPGRTDYKVKDVWSGQPAYVVGSGPSLNEFLNVHGWDWLDGKNTIGINHTIEYYDRFRWLFFLDKRFVDRTKYDLKSFKGIIFAQNNTGFPKGDRVVHFKCTHNYPSNELASGLFSPNFSGLAALNLALLTGANPVYLLGFSMGKDSSPNGYHFDREYNGEIKEKKNFDKYNRVLKQYKKFTNYSSRIKNVSNYNPLPGIQNMKLSEFSRKHTDLKVTPRAPLIIHYSFSDNIEIHADITRALIQDGYGNHVLRNINEKNKPNADLYINEHFISTRQQTNLFPHKDRAINIVHSTGCIPAGPWKSVIALTETWRKYLAKHNIKAKVIRGGVDLEPYQDITPTDNMVFGRITRWSPGKIHPEWNRVVTEILDKVPESLCKMFVQVVGKGGRPLLKHRRMVYDESVKIDDFKGDRLKELGVYVHVNGSFRETMSHAVIEAMASGLPIIYLKEDVIKEVAGPAGVECMDINHVRDTVIQFLLDNTLRKEYYKKAKTQAAKWSLNSWVKNMNEEIQRCLKD